jgi:formylglycine-generating enzyme required for sulfatase activity
MGRSSVFPVIAIVAMALAAMGARPGMGAAGEGAKAPAAPTKESAAATSYTETAGGVNLVMVWIPGGTFKMGSRMSPEEVVKKYGGKAGDEKFFRDQHPVQEVELDGFWMGKFEVTNAQFRKFRPSHSSGEWEGRDLNGDNQPVVEVSWDDAKAFCDWLSEKAGKTYTLPTEAQWEYACRAGTETERYWGDDDETMGRYANVSDRTGQEAIKKLLEKNNVRWEEWFVANTTDGYVVSAPVGSFGPNKLGLCDMIGNVFEWCGDWYGRKYYGESPRRNPTGPAAGTFRVVRGGSWFNLPGYCRSANRYMSDPGLRDDLGGFRVVRTQK